MCYYRVLQRVLKLQMIEVIYQPRINTVLPGYLLRAWLPTPRAVLLADFCLRSVEVIYPPCACAKGLGHLWLPAGLKVSVGPNNQFIACVHNPNCVIFLLSSPKSALQWVPNPWYTLHYISPQDSSSRWKLRFLLLLACSKQAIYTRLLSSLPG